jgi:hypothetical protein
MEPINFISKECLEINKRGVRRWYGYIKGWKRIYRYRLVMMNFLHTSHIPKKFSVHHKNENTEDDGIENLELMTRKQHTALHNPRDYKYGVSRAEDPTAYDRLRRNDPAGRILQLGSQKKSYEKHKNDPDFITKKKKYNRGYIFKKRKSDPVFREQQLEYARAWRKRKKEESNALSQLQES